MKNNLINLVKPSWYVEQFNGWMTVSYLLLFGGVGALVSLHISHGDWSLYANMAALGGIFAFMSVLSVANRKAIAALFGTIGSLLIAIVSLHATAYADAFLQTIYFAAVYLPIVFIGDKWSTKPVKHTSKKGLVALVSFGGVAYAILYGLDANVFFSKSPVFDALVAALGLMGSICLWRNSNLQTIIWFLGGLVSIGLWTHLFLLGGATPVLGVTYVLFITNNIVMAFAKESPWRWKFLDKVK